MAKSDSRETPSATRPDASAKTLPDTPSLESLKRQAKALLRGWRAGAGEAEARVRARHPAPETFGSLRDAQLVVAREYGCAGWSELVEEVEARHVAALSLGERAALFARLACLDYRDDSPRRRERAQRMLDAEPALAGHDAHTAAVVADPDLLARWIASDPGCVGRGDGPNGGPPLATLCYARLPAAPGDPLAAATVLLDAGADPNVVLPIHDGYAFTPLTGVMGEGEGGVVAQPPHPQARALAELLLDRGASPNQGQGLYDTHFTPGNAWLELLLARGLTARDRAGWQGAEDVGTLDYLLGVSVMRGFTERVALLLEHGADPNGRDTYDGRPHYENALTYGHPEIAELLVAHGAERLELSPAAAFRAACFAADESAARAWLARDPSLVDDDRLVHDAIRFGREEAACLVFDLGGSLDARDQHHALPSLNQAALCGRERLVEKLLALGARLDVRDPTFGGTPIGAANHAGHLALRDRLLDRTDDVFDLAQFGRVDQLRARLARTPEAARATLAGGLTPLHLVRASDVADAARTIDLLLAAGADLEARSDAGRTPLGEALVDEAEEIVELLRARGAQDT